jgi:hypothetical protein
VPDWLASLPDGEMALCEQLAADPAVVAFMSEPGDYPALCEMLLLSDDDDEEREEHRHRPRKPEDHYHPGPCTLAKDPAKSKGLWHHKDLHLPMHLCHVARALHRKGMPISQAIAIARSRANAWVAKSKHADVKAHSAEDIGEWETERAAAHAEHAAKKAGRKDRDDDRKRTETTAARPSGALALASSPQATAPGAKPFSYGQLRLEPMDPFGPPAPTPPPGKPDPAAIDAIAASLQSSGQAEDGPDAASHHTETARLFLQQASQALRAGSNQLALAYLRSAATALRAEAKARTEEGKPWVAAAFDPMVPPAEQSSAQSVAGHARASANDMVIAGRKVQQVADQVRRAMLPGFYSNVPTSTQLTGSALHRVLAVAGRMSSDDLELADIRGYERRLGDRIEQVRSYEAFRHPRTEEIYDRARSEAAAGRYDNAKALLERADGLEAHEGVAAATGSRGVIQARLQEVQRSAAGEANARGMKYQMALAHARRVYLHESTGINANIIHPAQLGPQTDWNALMKAHSDLLAGKYDEADKGLAGEAQRLRDERKTGTAKRVEDARAKVARAVANRKETLPALEKVEGGPGGLTAVDHTGERYQLALKNGTVTVTGHGRTLAGPAGSDPTQAARELAGKLAGVEAEKPAKPAVKPEHPLASVKFPGNRKLIINRGANGGHASRAFVSHESQGRGLIHQPTRDGTKIFTPYGEVNSITDPSRPGRAGVLYEREPGLVKIAGEGEAARPAEAVKPAARPKPLRLKPGEEHVHASGEHEGVKWEDVTRRPPGAFETRSWRLEYQGQKLQTLHRGETPEQAAGKFKAEVDAQPAKRAAAEEQQQRAISQAAHEMIARDRQRQRDNPLDYHEVLSAYEAAHGRSAPPSMYRRWAYHGVRSDERNSGWYQLALRRKAGVKMTPADSGSVSHLDRVLALAQGGPPAAHDVSEPSDTSGSRAAQLLQADDSGAFVTDPRAVQELGSMTSLDRLQLDAHLAAAMQARTAGHLGGTTAALGHAKAVARRAGAHHVAKELGHHIRSISMQANATPDPADAAAMKAGGKTIATQDSPDTSGKRAGAESTLGATGSALERVIALSRKP